MSVKIESTKRLVIGGLAGKITPNIVKNLATRWKTFRAGMRRQSHPALTNAKGVFRYG